MIQIKFLPNRSNLFGKIAKANRKSRVCHIVSSCQMRLNKS